MIAKSIKKVLPRIETFMSGMATAFDMTGGGYVNSRRTSIGRSIRGDFARVGNDLRTAAKHVQSASQTDLFDEQTGVPDGMGERDVEESKARTPDRSA